MKKIVFMVVLLAALLSTNNHAYASGKMISENGDHRLNFQTLSPYTFMINDFYAGIELKNIYLHPGMNYVDNRLSGELHWKNPEYKLEIGYQAVDLIFTDQTGKDIEFTIGLLCDKYYYEVARYLIY